MQERTERKVDDAVEQATEFLDNLLNEGLGWVLNKVNQAAEKAEEKEAENAEEARQNPKHSS